MLKNISDAPLILMWGGHGVSIGPGKTIDMAIFGAVTDKEKYTLEDRFISKLGAASLTRVVKAAPAVKAPPPVKPEVQKPAKPEKGAKSRRR